MSAAKAAVVDCSDDFVVDDAAPQRGPLERETDAHRIAQRQKQIDMGKNTLGYQIYRQQVPRERRVRKVHPTTPDVYQVVSKRQFDGQVKKWRRMLHQYDPKDEGEQQKNGQGGPSSNPLAPEMSCELVSQDDFQGGSPAVPKNGGRQRPGGGAQPPKTQTLTALRKRNFTESSKTSRPFSPTTAALSQPGASKQAKTYLTLAPSRVHMAVQSSLTVAAAATSAAAAEEEGVDYGEDEDWAYVDPAEKAGTTIYTNWGALEADSSLDDVMV